MNRGLDQPPIAERLRLYERTARRAAHRYGINPTGVLGRVSRRAVFVIGCPRSGTTFTAKALGRLPGFVDLGEVNRLKAGIPGLYLAATAGRTGAVVDELRTVIWRSQRVAMSARRRGIEQTPESTYLIPELARAFPEAHFVHLVRDGRDVVASLMERGWLAGEAGHLVPARAGGESLDDAGHPFGGYARFWVESGREAEFEAASEARRCAWAWRRYVTTALNAIDDLAPGRVSTISYEQLVTDPEGIARRMATELDVPDAADDLLRALSSAHSQSVGRYVDRLTPQDLIDVMDEAGGVLTRLKYPTDRPAAGSD